MFPISLTSLRERIMWQDSLLSVAFDRPSTIMAIDRHSSFRAPMPAKATYRHCMQRLCEISLDLVQYRTPRLSANALGCIFETHQKIESVVPSATDHIIDVKNCKSLRDQLEHWNIQMHVGYITSELCRPLLGHTKKDDASISTLLAACFCGIRQAINGFINLQRVTAYARYSWVAVSRALSSALLLCIIPETRHEDQTHEVVRRLIKTLSDIYSDVDPVEVPTPISRALSVLGKLVFADQGADQQSTDYDFEARFDAQLDDMAAGWINSFSTSPVGLSSLTDFDGSPYTAMNFIMWGNNREPSM